MLWSSCKIQGWQVVDYFVVCLNHMKRFKFVKTLKVTFVKRITDENEYRPIYFNSKPKTSINSEGFMSNLRLTQLQSLNSIGVWISEGSSWTISSIDGIGTLLML